MNMYAHKNIFLTHFTLLICFLAALWFFPTMVGLAEEAEQEPSAESEIISDDELLPAHSEAEEKTDEATADEEKESDLESTEETYPPEVRESLEKIVSKTGLTLFTPFNYALVERQQLYLIGDLFDPLIKDVTFQVNGKQTTYPIVDRTFHVTVDLIEGENEIVLADDAKLMVYFNSKSWKMHRPPKKPEIPPRYVKYVFHSNLKSQDCITCHRLGPEIAGLPDCYIKCHIDVLAKNWAHGPTGEFRCLACHDPFGDKNGYEVILAGKELCLSCHVTMKFDKPYVHTAIKEGMCLGCHDPHSTPYLKVLRYQGSQLCYTCHEIKTKARKYYRGEVLFEEENNELLLFQHPPVEEGRCLYCHEPHESKYKNNLKKAPTFLCSNFDCHGALALSPLDGKGAGHVHPFDKDPATSIMAKVPNEIKRDEREFVVCYSCHDPHGSNRDSFLIDVVGARQRGKKLCGKCHPPVETIDGKGVELNIGRDE